MTIPNSNRRTDAIGNDSTAVYPYTFRIRDALDLGVYLLRASTGVQLPQLVRDTDYTVDGPYDQDAGGTITIINPGLLTVNGYLPTNDHLTIIGERTAVQPTSFKNQSQYFPVRHENSFDNDIVISQQLDELVSRALLSEVTNDVPMGFISGPLNAKDVIQRNKDNDGWEYKPPEEVPASADAVKWLNLWAAGTYAKNDMVRDGSWLMVANKITTERAAPQDLGLPTSNVPVPASFTITPDTSVVRSEHLYTFVEAGYAQELSVYVPEVSPTTVHKLLVIDETDPLVPITVLFLLPVLTPLDWTTVKFSSKLVTIGTIWRVILQSQNTGSSTPTIGGWNYNGTSQNNGPAAQGWNRNNRNSTLRIDKTDLDSVNRATELMGMTAGTEIQFNDAVSPGNFYQFETTGAPIDQGTYVEFPIFLVAQGGSLNQVATDMTAATPIAQPAQYVHQPNYWPGNLPTWATIAGEVEYDGVAQGGFTDSLLGIDITFQVAVLSPDWDVAALSGDGGGGGGDGGGAPDLTNLDKINFNAVGLTPDEGDLAYSATLGALVFKNNEADITLQIGQEIWLFARNDTGATITNGQVVYVSGSVGNKVTVALSQADTATTARGIGIATHDIEDNSNGYITSQGHLSDVDTSAWVEGDILWIDPLTAGALTNVRPTSPDIAVPIAVVTRSHVTQGSLYVSPSIPLSDLQTVYDSSPDGTILTDSVLGDLSVQRGSAADTDVVFSVKNGAGVPVFEVTGEGYGISGMRAPDIIIEDQKTAGTVGGGLSAGSWVTRTLNTLVRDVHNNVVLNANQFILEAGTYYIESEAPTFRVNNTQSRIRNMTDSADVVVSGGSHSTASSGSAVITHAAAVFTIPVSNAFEIQSRGATTNGSTGMGQSGNFGEPERYTSVRIWRLK